MVGAAGIEPARLSDKSFRDFRVCQFRHTPAKRLSGGMGAGADYGSYS